MVGTVLIVEDDHNVLRLLEDMLDAEGFTPIGVRRPAAVVDAALKCDPDLVLVDVMLPGSSGIDVADALRAAGFDETPMIAMSASSSMRSLALHTGLFHAAVTKPFDMGRLFDLINDLISMSHNRQVSPRGA